VVPGRRKQMLNDKNLVNRKHTKNVLLTHFFNLSHARVTFNLPSNSDKNPLLELVELAESFSFLVTIVDNKNI